MARTEKEYCELFKELDKEFKTTPDSPLHHDKRCTIDHTAHEWGKWAQFQEVMKLIAQYDWAVEDMPPPEGNHLTRAEATELRTKLVNLLKEN